MDEGPKFVDGISLPSIGQVVRKWEDHIGVDRLREFVKQPRRIVPPNGFNNPWHWWVMAAVTKATDKETDAGYVAQGVINRLNEHDSPTYFVGRDVVEAMERTDFGNAPMRDIKWPHEGILFMLPDCEELKYETVSELNRDGEPVVVRSISRPVGIAIANVWSYPEDEPGIAILVVDALGACSWSFMPYRDTWQEAIDYIRVRDSLPPVSPRKPWQTALAETEREALFKNASLVFKVMCLWNSERRDGLSEMLQTGGGMIRKGDAKRTGNKAYDLWSGLCLSLNGALSHDPDCHGEDFESKVRRHWRRGHFRNQPHGPGRAMRKSVWIRPYMAGSL